MTDPAAKTTRRGPTLIEGDLSALPPAPEGPGEAPPVDDDDAGGAATTAMSIAARRSSTLSRVFWAAVTGLASLGLGLWFWETAEALLSRNIWLGRIALALAAAALISFLIMAANELASLARIRRVESLRDEAARARAARDRAAATQVLATLDRLYRDRAETAAARAAIAAKSGDVMDADALIDLAERELTPALDAAAEAAVRRGARNAAAATAFIPFALVDVAAALAINLRMIRSIAEIYGGRAGWLGSWRLLRAVAAHLAAAGAIAVGDDLIGPALGGGVVGKLSRRFGEGLVNGALTARIGVAAIEVCRPLPFVARPRPGVRRLIAGALSRDPG